MLKQISFVPKTLITSQKKYDFGRNVFQKHLIENGTNVLWLNFPGNIEKMCHLQSNKVTSCPKMFENYNFTFLDSGAVTTD